MNTKKSFRIYYLLIGEGTTEFNLFAYLTKNRFRDSFEKSNIQFSIKVEIVEYGISQGKLNGAGNLSSFRGKYNSIKDDDRYKGQKLFFIIDKDLDDSPQIETLIKDGGDIVQFVEYNSEYLLLKFAEKNPKNPLDFNTLTDFRTYIKNEFQKQFKKAAPKFKEPDFELIFNRLSDKKIRASFIELFSTLSS